MKLNAGLLSVVLLIVSGCANVATIERSTALGGRTAVHLDAPQRLVFASPPTASRSGHLCAEPSPDALQAYASSFGLGLSVPSQGAASLAQAFQTGAGSIGLRTQSITLLRDTLYRICEADSNGTLAPGDVVQLLEHSQDLTLGILAIEQLTGAVVARQVALTGSANAESSSNVANTQAALDRVKRNEEAKKSAVDAAKADEKPKVDAAAKNKVELDGLEAKKKAGTALTATETARLDELTKERQAATDATAARVAAEKDYDDAKKATKAVQDNFNTAVATASATASTSAAFSGGSDRANIVDKDTAAYIANATANIVATVAYKGHLTDGCRNIMTRYAVETDAAKQSALYPIWFQCARVIEVYLQRYLNAPYPTSVTTAAGPPTTSLSLPTPATAPPSMFPPRPSAPVPPQPPTVPGAPLPPNR